MADKEREHANKVFPDKMYAKKSQLGKICWGEGSVALKLPDNLNSTVLFHYSKINSQTISCKIE